MDTQIVKRQYHLNQWAQVIQQCRESGQTISAWCADNNINPKKYYYWLRCVRKAACETLPIANEPDPTSVPLAKPLCEKHTAGFAFFLATLFLDAYF